MKICQCGCGRPVLGKTANYLKGHGRKNRKNSPEHTAKIAAANKGLKRSPEQVEQMRQRSMGKRHTEETKLNMSLKARELGFGKWMTGRKLSSETIEKCRLKRTGIRCSDDTKVKISNANKGENNGMYGNTHTEEVREKISKASKEMWTNKREELMLKIFTPENRQKLKIRRSKMIFPLKDTAPEVKMKEILQILGLQFKQHIYITIPSAYQVDFLLPDFNLVIEVDGVYWHNFPHLREIDIKRTKELQEDGYEVLRLWEHEVDKLTPEIFLEILSSLDKSVLDSIPLTKKYQRFAKKYGI
jgi:very-short-patch-repair endonuclease